VEFFRHSLNKKRSGTSKPPPLLQYLLYSAFYIVALLEPLYTPSCIHHPLLTSKKGVALAAQLNLQSFSGGTNGEGIATGTGYLSIRVVFGMNFFLHSC